MLGFIIGAASGIVQHILLSKINGSGKRGKVVVKTLLFLLTQFLLPFTVLLLCAFFLTNELLLVVIGMAVAIVASLIIKFIISKKGKR